ncbi:MAG: hypothetical protein WCR58_10785 [Bacteroidales bacterium]|jgi:hypothetical protein|nr:hypothetical protein [Acholeplasmataceae bacterium]MCK9290222.1 hypothetical protein [Bacteroidales bacterium]MDD3702345.1 hypothetical protein [Bacteroidales bacterium]MDY0370297.1 hypothetical protein [Bacteroidales bacterium]
MKNVQFEKDILLVPNLFDKLSIVEENEERFLKGSLDIIDGTGKVWETFDVEIKGSESYPYSFPKLFETNGAFPKNADWHVYENDASCCVDVPMNEKIICKNGLIVSDYITQYAIPYLANQTYRIREGYYLYGEYSHGILGRLEFYQSKLKAKNLAELIKMFDLIIKDYNPDRRSMCPFCHKEKFRRCHRDAFRDLQLVKGFLAKDGLIFLKVFEENLNYKLPTV